jgi:hypothetical protein
MFLGMEQEHSIALGYTAQVRNCLADLLTAWSGLLFVTDLHCAHAVELLNDAPVVQTVLHQHRLPQ